jgi:hypothetical protein
MPADNGGGQRHAEGRYGERKRSVWIAEPWSLLEWLTVNGTLSELDLRYTRIARAHARDGGAIRLSEASVQKNKTGSISWRDALASVKCNHGKCGIWRKGRWNEAMDSRT